MFYCLQGIYQYLCHGISNFYSTVYQCFIFWREKQIFIKLIKYISY